MRTIGAMAALAITICGCATSAVETFRAEGLQRASFEMKCPAEQLQVRELSSGRTLNGNLEGQVGVSGCGVQAVYVKQDVSSWLRNSEVAQQ
jgi:hypothetical protein